MIGGGRILRISAGILGTLLLAGPFTSPGLAGTPTTQESASASGVSQPAPGVGQIDPAVEARNDHSTGHRSNTSDDFSNLSLEQLMQVQVETDTLTPTQRNLVPAAVTTIDRALIDQQNPRTVNDILSIYVPDYQTSSHPFEEPSNGFRGIIGDNNTKYLFLVDGREMNERTHAGVTTEQDLYLTGDIEHMDVVRGPGSATYGPGAVAGVISLQTYNGLNFQGSEVTVKGGEIFDYLSAEIKRGEKLTPDSGWFVYFGAAQVSGASEGDAPIVQGQNYTATNGATVTAGNGLGLPLNREGAQPKNQPQLKFHAEYDSGGFTAWTRYTNSGLTQDPIDRTYANFPAGFGSSLAGDTSIIDVAQWTTFAGYKMQLGDKLDLDTSTSYDITEYQRTNFGTVIDNHGEDKWISKARLNWQMTSTNQLAVGTEFGYYWLDQPTIFIGPSTVVNSNLPGAPGWTSYMLSFLAEDQWHFAKQWTLFLSGRADKDRFTDWLYSPRGALAWEPDSKDTVKFIASESLRTNTEEFLYANWQATHTDSPPENSKSLELRYERQQNANLFFAGSIYYDKLDAINWNNTLKQEQNLGQYQTAGFELEATYRTPDDVVTISHGFTQLVGQNFIPNSGTLITSAPFGFGYDLNNWSNNETKLSLHHQFNPHFSADGNIQVLWGFPGGRAYQDYKNTLPFQGPGGVTDTIPGYNQPYTTTAYLNLGAEYKFDEHSTVRLDAYNVLGWIDQNLNKDNVLGSIWTGEYRVQAPAFAITYRLTF